MPLLDRFSLAGAVVFVASDASAYVSGTNIPVDGGYTAKEWPPADRRSVDQT